ncbi:Gfo/Idh/MocA family oxidoreductase [Natronolimnobius sp. AArcel1]|uniref:Gfo/Idh/MocA family protein n=1 Tax=Natronolimnobius sp. AArcel1 TaxID=1679093 RepID=UPI0013ED8D55|nr:Gfo/Idh/MocA family oxidoreductase [Natronolimnobius sp. AArcel1]NGM70558.1 Gfo/Idh/MocA family oxidoreductase [Natronolimnobius sp. AArcel1]
MNAPTQARVGLVGLGNIGCHHADQLVELGANLTAGLDIDETARDEFREAYGVETFETPADFYDVVDAVIVTTPNRFHEEYAVGALEAGLDVLLEKPLAHSLESARRIADAAAAADGFCMVGFNNRFSNAVTVAKAYQDRGTLGEITHIEANYVRRRGIPGRGSWFTTKSVAGGGALIDLGIHAIDLALHFMEFPEVVDVSGATRSQFGGREDYTYLEMYGDDAGPDSFNVDDSVSAFIRCANGRTISLEVAWAANRPPNDEFLIRGTKAGARVRPGLDGSEQELTIYDTSSDGTDHLIESDIDIAQQNTHRIEQSVFLEGVRAGKHPGQNTVTEGIAVQRVVDSIFESSDQNRPVELGQSLEPVRSDD